MKNKNIVNTLTIICCGCMIGFMTLFTFWCYKSMTNKKEIAIICNTEIGTDSVLAVHNMNNRLKNISLNEYSDTILSTTDEGYGYDYKGETLRFKFADNRVIEMTYYNSNIDTISIVCESKEYEFNKNSQFIKKCENFIIYYNGENTFNVRKH